MFINTIQNNVAKLILSRIYAIRMAEYATYYDYAATIVESVNWAADSMLKHEKEYNALHKFWAYSLKKCESRNMRGLVKYNAEQARYEIVPASSMLHKVWYNMRKAK